ncbi:MAG: signal peptidase II [Gammaproteobacteria bacterium]|nr:signal peptidase II [Gammaproteobacteria bacterium]
MTYEKKWVWFLLCAVFVALDQATKFWVYHALDLYQSVAVFPGLNWTLVLNPGSAFGFLSHHDGHWHHYLFVGFGVLMSLGLIIWMGVIAAKSKLELLAVTLVLSGAIGNVIDRLRLGYVIDFIDVYYKNHHWWIFNVADSAICVGAVLLFFAGNETKDKLAKKK